jgi:CRISPR/Cas system Type II protein with McrA/HNH and RuvC-like nuclease domain
MIIFSIDDLSLREIKALRKSLDYIPISGIDASFIALLQHKVASQIQTIENHIKQEEFSKQNALEKAIQSDPETIKKQNRGKKKS